MGMILSIAILGLFAQLDPAPEDTGSYVFVNREDSTIRLNVLVDPKELAQTFSPFLIVILDEPWLADAKRHLKIRRSDYEEAYLEAPTTRNRRIREGWAAHGGVEVDTPEGPVWVHETENEFALRAKNLAAGAGGGDVTVSAQGGPSVDGGGGEALGFWPEWGVHILLVVGAAGLSALVVWITMLRGPWTPLGS